MKNQSSDDAASDELMTVFGHVELALELIEAERVLPVMKRLAIMGALLTARQRILEALPLSEAEQKMAGLEACIYPRLERRGDA